MVSCSCLLRIFILLVGGVLAVPAFAAAPVSGFYGSTSDQQTAPVDKAVLDDFVVRLNQLQQEVQELRGLVEEHSHTIVQLKQQQEQAYADFERRLQQQQPKGRLLNEPGRAAPSASRAHTPPVRTPPVPPPSYEEVMPPQDESAPVSDRPAY